MEGLFFDVMKEGSEVLFKAEARMTGAANAQAILFQGMDLETISLLKFEMATIKKALSQIYEATVDVESASGRIKYLLLTKEKGMDVLETEENNRMIIPGRTAKLIMDSECLFDVYASADFSGAELSLYNEEWEFQICDTPGQTLDFALKKDGKYLHAFSFDDVTSNEKQMEVALKLSKLFVDDVRGSEIVFQQAEDMNYVDAGLILKKIENPRGREKSS